MSDLKMRKKLQATTELTDEIEKADKRLRAIPTSMSLRTDKWIANQKKALDRGSSDAHGPPQLTTGGGPLPLRTIPMCEFCYLSMRPTDNAQYCIEHDMGGHKNCYKLHETTVHQ